MPTPNDPLFSTKSYTECPLFSFSGRHLYVTFIFECPPGALPKLLDIHCTLCDVTCVLQVSDIHTACFILGKPRQRWIFINWLHDRVMVIQIMEMSCPRTCNRLSSPLILSSATKASIIFFTQGDTMASSDFWEHLHLFGHCCDGTEEEGKALRRKAGPFLRRVRAINCLYALKLLHG